VLFRARRWLKSRDHDLRCRGVLKTKPLRIVPSELRILSLLCHADVLMYLIAVKSLYARIGEGEILIIDDGSLTQSDRALLAEHLKPHIAHIDDVPTGACPRGGCWERLLKIVDLTTNFYVIQLDADTVTRGEIPEVVDCVRSNRSFTLGTRLGKDFASAAEVVKLLGSAEDSHVQVCAERNLGNIPDAVRRRYVRGSAGFAGFARHSQSVAAVESFSKAMAELLGRKWLEWGSEQVASNYLIANSPEAVVLPYPKYACFDLRMDPGASSFLHFIGSNRFDRGVYARESRGFISSAEG
jgi:hypothetical protein